MTEIAIIGDRFMLSDMFEDALIGACGPDIACRKLDLPWPDEPMEHGYAAPGLEGLKEYMGDPEQVIAHVGGAPVLVTHLAPLSRDMLAQMPGLKLVAVSRGGPVNIDMEAARDRGVTVVNAPGRNASAVAEFTIGAILAETRNITRGHDGMRAGNYRGDLYRADVAGDELSDMTVGVIGYGAIGTRVVRLLHAFGCRVMVTDPYVQLSPEDLTSGVEQVVLERLLAEADVVTLHPRVTPETTGMIGADALTAMKPTATLVNTGAGAAGRLRRSLSGTCPRSYPRRDAGDLCHRAHPCGVASAAPAKCYADPPYRRRLTEDCAHRRGQGRRGSPAAGARAKHR